MIDLKGKTALLTASGQGVGKATAKVFSEAGAYVIATDINEKSLSSLQEFVDETHILDVTNKEAVKKLVSSIKAPNILFNCAGVVHNGTILEAHDDEWDFAFNLNGKAMYHMIKEVIPIMIKNGGGSIVNSKVLAYNPEIGKQVKKNNESNKNNYNGYIKIQFNPYNKININ